MFELKDNPFPNIPVIEPKVVTSLVPSQDYQPRPSPLPLFGPTPQVYSYSSEYEVSQHITPKSKVSKGKSNFWLVILILGIISLIGYYLFKRFWPEYKDRILLFLGIPQRPAENGQS